MRKFFFSFIFLSLLFPIRAKADSLTVFDTAGVVRAQQEIDAKGGSVQFTLTDEKGNASDEIEVILTNKDTGEKLNNRSKSGVVLFEHVSAGSWIVSTPGSNIIFTAVSIAPVELAGGLGALGLSSTTITLGGITAVTATTVAIAASNGGSSDVMSPSS